MSVSRSRKRTTVSDSVGSSMVDSSISSDPWSRVTRRLAVPSSLSPGPSPQPATATVSRATVTAAMLRGQVIGQLLLLDLLAVLLRELLALGHGQDVLLAGA